MNRSATPRAPDTLWPPRLAADLKLWLCEQYPDKDRNLLGVAANQIDGLARDMLRAERGVKITTLKRGRLALPSAVKKRPSAASALRRIDAAIKSGRDHQYAKAIAEAPADVLALIEQVRGSSEWGRDETVSGLPMTSGQVMESGDKKLVQVQQYSIPAPAAVVPHLAEASALASKPGDWSGWRRDRTVVGIAIWYERVTGERPRLSSKAGTSRRSGSFYDFLDGLEDFYRAHLPFGFRLKFGVQNSGAAAARLFGRH